jgi:hypothetical protein
MVFAVVILPRLKRKNISTKKRQECDRSILSMANSTKSYGDMFILFKKPSNYLSYGSLVAEVLIAAENNSKLSH